MATWAAGLTIASKTDCNEITGLTLQAIGWTAADEAKLSAGGAAVAILPEARHAAHNKSIAIAGERVG